MALGEAKASGGDRVCLAEDPALERRSLERNTFDVLQGLVIAIDTKDRYTKRHSDDVARYGLFLAEQLGVDPDLAARSTSPASSTTWARSASRTASCANPPP